MDSLLFGISGIPNGDGIEKFSYSTGIEYLKNIGLDAMELPFVRSVNITDKNKDIVLKKKNENNLYISAHGSYYINLNSDEEEKQKASLERIVKGAEALKKVEGRSLIFHPGFYLKDSKEETFHTIKENLKKLPDVGVDFRLETTGKPTQFGSLEENVALCMEVKTCKLCIDFCHLHARYNGLFKTVEDFDKVLSYVGEKLGAEALKDMHIHMSGVNYGIKGEKNHLPFKESDFPYEKCIKSFVKFDIKGCIVCESPLLEEDSLLIKRIYEAS
ncbi:TIM barrel protein [Clostridium felsineum]|uniref:TIM barrel protein n=1 Tax=Clostridium felsineum TaxID=36839 RepID=UPI00214D9FDF|nr:TIM barrel protein [Clostridium felsineum]MCR3761322.1 TIM barrel protein [Clostridium felsineum]